MKLKIGDKVPDFQLSDQDGLPFRLQDYIGKKNIVMYFYPKNETMVCTKQACYFRDYLADFAGEDAEVVGVSADPIASHASFAANHKLPYRLLSDEKGALRKLFGTSKTLGLLPERVTYLIDKQGIIRHIFSSQFRAEAHINQALTALRAMEK